MVKLRDNNTDAEKPQKGERLASLDATRGVFLLLLVSGGFGIKEMLRDDRWTWFTRQWSHSAWQGFTLWDLLCPAMLLIVGLAMPYSYANRQGKGHSWFRQLLHALVRAAVLIAVGIYLDSYFAKPSPRLVFDLRGDLQQIGLAYLIAFLVMPLGKAVQGVSAAFLLIGHTAAHVIYAFAVGHDLWSRDQNLGVALDQWLGFGPHADAATFNAFSSAAIVLLGVLVNGLVRSGATPGIKVAVMTGCSLAGILLGWALSGGGGVTGEWAAVIPMIRRLQTLTFVLTVSGWTLLVFTYFYLLMDGLLLRAWAVPLALVGRNSLLLYVGFMLGRGWAETSARLVLPASPPIVATLQPLLIWLIVLAIYWLLCFWLYRRRIFFKV